MLLGVEYEKKKQKLQQELRLDYQNYIAKKKHLKADEPRPQPQSLSLPIEDRRAAKAKLRDERHNEYNLFLKEQTGPRRLKRQMPHVASQAQASDAAYISSSASPLPALNTQPNTCHTHRERPPSRRDAATLTEPRGPRGRRCWQRPREELQLWERRGSRLEGHQVEYSSEEEGTTDKEEGLEFSHWTRQEPEYTERGERRAQQRRVDKAPQDMKEVDAPGAPDDQNRKSQSAKPLPILKMPDSKRTTERSRSAANRDKAEFATGLIIGAVEGNMASQMRKERYKQELLEQIAEQQRNKMREKDLELRVAATGATDPEKKPDRIKQFGAVNRQREGWRQEDPYKPGTGVDSLGNDPKPRPKDDKPILGTEGRGPTGRPQVAFPSLTQNNSTTLTGKTVPRLGMPAAWTVPSLSSFNEDYHRNLSSTLGEMAAPRLAGIPPPIHPTLTNTYKTPYDAAYYYYGARNPLDPNLPNYQNGPSGGGQQSGIFPNLPQAALPPRPNECTGETDQHGASGLAGGALPAERTKQTRDAVLSYREALTQQIKENEKHKSRQRDERERYDAKIQAEMMAYNPWGRSGGGAPIKDKGGNLISDLNQMHRTNEEAYVNPERSQPTLGAEDRAPSIQRVSGFTFQSPPQQLREQDSYRDVLKQQIEEKRRKQAEERERIRIEEEKEEKRLAEQRARMQQEYEEEQKRKKEEIEKRLENQRLNRQRDEHRQEEERRAREEQERRKNILGNRKEKEERQAPLQRVPSPPIPTLQKKLGNRQASRPPTVVSQLSSRIGSDRSAPAPHSPPVPARRNQLRAKENQHKVMSKLSALCRYLRNEQRQLESQLSLTAREETETPPPARSRGRPKVQAFDLALQRAALPSASRAQSGAARVNMQNIREFNQLKYRDSASRAEVLQAYPDPPTDAQTLDIQQQALLREQQRTIRNMKRGEEHNSQGQQLSHHHPGSKPAYNSQGDSELVSKSAFIDFCRSDASQEPGRKQTSPQASGEDGNSRTALRRPDDHDEVVIPAGQREREIQPDAPCLDSGTSLSVEAKVKAHRQHRTSRLDQRNGDRNGISEGPSGDEVDVSSLRSSPCALERRVSAETVATEPWLRPGTSDAVKRQGCRARPSSVMDNAAWLTHSLIQLQ